MSEIRSTSNPVFPGALSRTEGFEKYGGAAATAARTVDFQKAGQDALAGLMSVRYEGADGQASTIPGRPQLQAPQPRAESGKQEKEGDALTLLLAAIFGLLEDNKDHKRLQRLDALQKNALAKQQGLEKLSAEYKAAVDALAAAEDAVGSGHEKLEALRERVQHFQGLLEQSEARLAELDPESPEYAVERARRDQLKGELASHSQAFDKAVGNHLKLIEIANAAASKVASLGEKVQAEGLGGAPLKDTQEKALSSSGQALLHRFMIIELLGEAAQSKEELNQDVLLKLQAKLQEHMKLESEKYLEEVRKAEALQKTMGCIGKIVGAVLSVATIVAGVLTANPVLVAVGVIGAAVMIADAAIQEATGLSFMGEMMKPLITVMQEAIKLFTEISKFLLTEVFGVDEETAKDIAQIVGMLQGIIATMAAVALVAVVGAQVIGPVISAVASKLASVVTQVAPVAMQVLRQAASSVGNSLTQILTQLRGFITGGADPVSLARIAARFEIAQAITEAAGVATQGGLQIASGKHQAQAAVHLADVRVRMAISEEIASYLTRLVEDYGQAMQHRTRQIEQVFADMQRSHAVSLHMVRHI